MLEAKGGLTFLEGCLEWVRRALGAPGLALAALTPEIVVESSRLPGRFPGDPADRIIMATAMSLDAMLITQDQRMLAYARRYHLSAMPAYGARPAALA
jgi:PIN domain nuclease of toxin-antitoxin system